MTPALDRKELGWTDAEKAIVKQHYPVGGAAACKPLLPAYRTLGAIDTRAWLLGLQKPRLTKEQRRARGSYPTSDAMDQQIRDRWASMDGKGGGEISALAGELGVPRDWLTRRMTLLGLTIARRKEPDWTPAEDALFATLPLHNPKRAAQILRAHGFVRTPASIVSHAAKLKISRRDTHETYSANQAAPILGVDPTTVTTLCEGGHLVAERMDDARSVQQGGHRWAITPDDLRGYIRANIERIDLRRVDKLAFFHLIDSQPASAAPKAVPKFAESGWTAEKRRLAAKRFGEKIIETAWELNVPANELLAFALNGRVPPAAGNGGFADTKIESQEAAPQPLVALPAPVEHNKGGRPRTKWTPDMVAALQENAGTLMLTQLATLLGVSTTAVKDKARALELSIAVRRKLTPTPEQVLRLQQAAGRVDGLVLAAEFGVQIWTVRNWARDLGLKLAVPVWSDERVQQLRDGAGKVPAPELAEQLGVSPNALKTKASELGLSLLTVGSGRRVTIDMERVRELAGTMPGEDIAKALGLKLDTLRRHASMAKISLKFARPKPPKPTLVERMASKPVIVHSNPPLSTMKPATRAAVTALAKAAAKHLAIVGSPRPERVIVRRSPTSNSAAWVRLQHPDGRWLNSDASGWVKERHHGYICKPHQVAAAKARFELAKDCLVVDEPAWTARDIEASRGMR